MRVCESLIAGGISEVYFRYAAKLEGYTNLSSDIPELSEIFEGSFRMCIG